jgi:hypothetical protein
MMPVEEIKLTASFKEDRDVIAVRNLVKRYHEEYMNKINPKTSADASAR